MDDKNWWSDETKEIVGRDKTRCVEKKSKYGRERK